ncbi:MAG TPA: CDGSH iron-sulfur domain-containing protein [Gemmatimonadales bacterium]|nr:CDGSH iron-sulfur domain-containing protein [Gemmatimonadales bacterium]
MSSEGPEPRPIQITVKPRGTIVIEGPVIIRDRDGNEIPQPPAKHPGVVKLCGCGRSKTRPFCDGSHKRPPDEPPAA